MNMSYQLLLTILAIGAVFISVIYLFLYRENGNLSQFQKSSDYKFIELTNGLTAYKEFGSNNNTPIIMIHGGTVPSEGYTDFCKNLSQRGYWVICYDQFGRGYSDRPKIKYSMNIYQQQLDELLDHLNIDQFILYGVSMGAPIAIEFANNNINRSLAVGIQVPVVNINNFIFKILRIPFLGEITMRFFGIPLIKKRALEWGNEVSLSEELINGYINQLILPGSEYSLLSSSRYLFPKNYFSTYEVFSKSNIPLHIAYANDDTEVSPQSVESIISLNKDADVFVFSGGHAGSSKIPDKITNVFLDFLSSNLN